MEFGSSHDGVPAGGGRDSLRLPWRSRAGKSQHLIPGQGFNGELGQTCGLGECVLFNWLNHV
jgi:hypothetical protein